MYFLNFQKGVFKADAIVRAVQDFEILINLLGFYLLWHILSEPMLLFSY